MGPYLDKMKPVYQSLVIPKCNNMGTVFYYNIPSSFWESYEETKIYNFGVFIIF